jgi:hypothetical protein
LRFTQAYLNQTLNLTAILGVFGKKGDEGGFARASLDYAIDDKISISGGIIDYIGGSSMTDPIRGNDRIFTKIPSLSPARTRFKEITHWAKIGFC